MTAAPVSLLLEILLVTMRSPKPQTEARCKESGKALHWEIILEKAP